MNNELLFQIALTKIPGVGNIHAKSLIHHFKTPSNIFKASSSHLEKIEGIGSIRAHNIKKFDQFATCEKEITFIEKNSIEPLFFTSANYPKRLLHCHDHPILLYYKGNVDLNASKIVSVVGTRNYSEYGKMACQQIITALKEYQVIIVSGLAYGIDTHAHHWSLVNNCPTLAILAHGLDSIYPPSNQKLSREIMENGGLLTEFPNGQKPDKQNFPKRNRITAGMCDALVVIESGKKGGSLITADIANSYHKDVFAIPGRLNDAKSEGCNILIQTNKAILVQSGEDIAKEMGWKNEPAKKNIQKRLFEEMNEEELLIFTIIKERQTIHLDELFYQAKLPHTLFSKTILQLEIKQIISAIPGKQFQLT